MNRIIFANTFKRNWKLLLTFLVVLCAYLSIIISLIDPDDMSEVQALFGTMAGFMDAFSIEIAAMTTPLNYTASTFFSVLVMGFTMVFYVIQVSRLILKPVDDTSLACTLSAPVKRSTLVFTYGLYLVFSMAVLFAGIFLCGCGMLNLYGPFDVGAYAKLVGVTFCLCTAVAMLSYFVSVTFCASRAGFGLTVGVPIALLFLQVLGGAGQEQTEWLSKITPFGYLDSVGIVTGEAPVWALFLVFGGATAALLVGTVWAFNKKQLPI